MDTLSKGTVRMDGRDISHFNRTQLENYRRYDIGFVFQFYNLIPNLTALENVEIAAQLCTDAIPAEDVLRAVGLHDRMQNFLHSFGRRAAACFHSPAHSAKNRKLLLCDEPTGAPDYEDRQTIFKAFAGYLPPRRLTVVITAQCGACRAMADRIIRVKSGHIYSVRMNEHITPVEQIEW